MDEDLPSTNCTSSNQTAVDKTVLNFELKSNKALKNHQIFSCSFCAVQQSDSTSTRLILSSVYFSPDSLQSIQEKIQEWMKSLPNVSKDSDKMSSPTKEFDREPGFRVLQEVRRLMDQGGLPRGEACSSQLTSKVLPKEPQSLMGTLSRMPGKW